MYIYIYIRICNIIINKWTKPTYLLITGRITCYKPLTCRGSPRQKLPFQQLQLDQNDSPYGDSRSEIEVTEIEVTGIQLVNNNTSYRQRSLLDLAKHLLPVEPLKLNMTRLIWGCSKQVRLLLSSLWRSGKFICDYQAISRAILGLQNHQWEYPHNSYGLNYMVQYLHFRILKFPCLQTTIIPIN